MSEVERLSASRPIAASAAAIFAVLSDPRGHVAIDSSGMLQSAPDARRVAAVGDQFVVNMDRESLGDLPLGRYAVTNIVTRYEADRLLEWSISGVIQPPIGHVYGYQLEQAGPGTTLVTSYYDWSGISADWRALGIFPVIPVSALRATLGILERVVRVGLPLDMFG